MKFQIGLAVSLAIIVVSVASADTQIVFEDFESYADTSELLAAWPSSTGSDNGTFLFDENTPGQPFPLSPSPGALDGKAALFDGSLGVGAGTVNTWAGSFDIAPSATQNVVLEASIGDDGTSANKKITVGLRSTAPENLIEMGFYNAPPFYAFRAQLFFVGTEGNPNWVPFELDASLDSPSEVGPGFHTYKAVISVDQIEFSLDLYGDGMDNANGVAGVDATRTVGVVTTGNGFNNLRFGIPSATGSSPGPFAAFDNISLRLEDIVATTEDADFNDDGLVDGEDFLIWQRGYGTPDAQNVNGDANGDNSVDEGDLTIWKNQYGGAPPLSAVAAVPEPSTTVLLIATGLALIGIRRQSY